MSVVGIFLALAFTPLISTLGSKGTLNLQCEVTRFDSRQMKNFEPFAIEIILSNKKEGFSSENNLQIIYKSNADNSRDTAQWRIVESSPKDTFNIMFNDSSGGIGSLSEVTEAGQRRIYFSNSSPADPHGSGNDRITGHCTLITPKENTRKQDPSKAIK
jgi:hypothetical protein